MRDIRTAGSVPATIATYTVDRLNDALAVSDFVILSIPLNDETFNLMADAQFRAMKPTAALINISRGPNVSREALDRALAENRREKLRNA